MLQLQMIQHLSSPPPQTLRTLQPTPSTVSFTVSTRPVPKTLSALLGYYVSILLKFMTGALLGLSVLAKWRISLGKGVGVPVGALEEALGKLLEGLQWRYLIPGILVVLWRVLQRGYTEESLLVLRSLGLQTSTTSGTYLSSATKRFIPSTSIQDIFIHEAFKGFEVKFYLAIVVKEEEDVIVVFPKLLPRRAILEEVWRGARACLYDNSGVDKENT